MTTHTTSLIPASDLVPAPADMGLSCFSSWRPGQIQAIEEYIHYQGRFLAQNMGTGFGKSGVCIADGFFTGNTLVLTSTKALQKQYMDDFSASGLVDVRGQANYTCTYKSYANGDPYTCDEGADHKCRGRKDRTCSYSQAVDTAVGSQFVVTNYSYWVSLGRAESCPLAPHLLVLDEAHAAHDELCSIMTGIFHPVELSSALAGEMVPELKTPSQISEWINPRLYLVQQRLEELKANLDSGNKQVRASYRKTKELLNRLTLLAVADNEHWEMEISSDGVITCSPVWASPYTEQWLFRGAPKILLVSATVGQKSLELLGIKGKGGEKTGNVFRFSCYPWDFPPENQPVYYCPTVRVDFRMDLMAEQRLIAFMVKVCREREDRKGIIHSVSYDRGKWIAVELSRAGIKGVLTHDPGQVEQAIETYKQANHPMVLISPVVTTGYDFPGTDCEYQIIMKVPTPDTRSPIMKRRCKEDPEYKPYLVAQTICQAVGRGRRSAQDSCETFIPDVYFGDLWAKHQQFFPPDFRKLVHIRPGGAGITPLSKIKG